MTDYHALRVLIRAGFRGHDLRTSLKAFLTRSRSTCIQDTVRVLRETTANMTTEIQIQTLRIIYGSDAVRVAQTLIARY